MFAEEYPSLADISLKPDTRPNEKLERRFINDVFQDAVQLKDADVPTVRKYFNNWLASRNGDWNGGNIRFASCILLDTATLLHLQSAWSPYPDNIVSANRLPYWVKMVEAEPQPVDAFRVKVFGEWGLAEYWFERNYRRRDDQGGR